MQVVILAGGFGTRLSEETKKNSKTNGYHPGSPTFASGLGTEQRTMVDCKEIKVISHKLFTRIKFEVVLQRL